MAQTLGLGVIFLAVTTVSAYLVINEPRVEECSRTGPRCTSDCRQVIFCAIQGGEPIEVTTCDQGFCHVPDAADGADSYPQCGGESCKSDTFLCLAPGGLPDPYNKTAYYLCPDVFMNGIRVACPDGQSFDVEKRICADTAEAKVISDVTCPPQSFAFGKLDALGIYCYMCTEQGNLIPYPCSLESEKGKFFGIGYQLPSY